jgi:hypothetical protein
VVVPRELDEPCLRDMLREPVPTLDRHDIVRAMNDEHRNTNAWHDITDVGFHVEVDRLARHPWAHRLTLEPPPPAHERLVVEQAGRQIYQAEALAPGFLLVLL